MAQFFAGDIGVFLVLAMAFIAAALTFFAAVTFLGSRGAVRRRLMGTAGPGSAVEQGATLRFQEREADWLAVFKPLYEPFLPSGEDRLAPLRKRLVQAGYMHPVAIRIYYALRILSPLMLSIGFVFLMFLVFPKTAPNTVLLGALILVLVGYLGPSYFLDRQVSTRQRKVREGFPDALDMLLVCVEAGLGLDAAVDRVGREIDRAHPVIAEQFRLVGNELRAGKSRVDALRSLSERTGVEEVGTLVSLLIQSDELGASIAQALRVHAAEMRATRILNAEEAAHKIPVKMAFPLMFGLIPVVMIVTVAPAMIKMVKFLFPILAQSSMGDLQQ